MYDTNRVLRLRLNTVGPLRYYYYYLLFYYYAIWQHDYDICLLVLLKCIANYESLTQSMKSATMIPTLSGLQMRILSEFRTLSNFIIS